MYKNQHIKNFLSVLFLLSLFIIDINIYAQKNYLNNLKWGISVDQAKEYYPKMKLMKKDTFFKSLYFTSMYTVYQYYNNYGAEEALLHRDFFFCYDKLGIERIRYYSASPLDLLTEINEIYGEGEYKQKVYGWSSKQIKQNIRTWILPSGTTLIMIYFNSTSKTNLNTTIWLEAKNFYLNVVFIPPHIVKAYFEEKTTSIIRKESMKNLNSFIYRGLY